jgi:hypothetical protein
VRRWQSGHPVGATLRTAPVAILFLVRLDGDPHSAISPPLALVVDEC